MDANIDGIVVVCAILLSISNCRPLLAIPTHKAQLLFEVERHVDCAEEAVQGKSGGGSRMEYRDAGKQSKRPCLPQNHHWREIVDGDGGGDDDVFIRRLARGRAFKSGHCSLHVLGWSCLGSAGNLLQDACGFGWGSRVIDDKNYT